MNFLGIEIVFFFFYLSFFSLTTVLFALKNVIKLILKCLVIVTFFYCRRTLRSILQTRPLKALPCAVYVVYNILIRIELLQIISMKYFEGSYILLKRQTS